MRWLRRVYARLTMRHTALRRLRRYRDEDLRQERLHRFARANQHAILAALHGRTTHVTCYDPRDPHYTKCTGKDGGR